MRTSIGSNTNTFIVLQNIADNGYGEYVVVTPDRREVCGWIHHNKQEVGTYTTRLMNGERLSPSQTNFHSVEAAKVAIALHYDDVNAFRKL